MCQVGQERIAPINEIFLAAAVFLGGLISSLIGFCGSKEHWSDRKFVKSILVSLLAAITFGAGIIPNESVTVRTIFASLAYGAGADAVVNRLGKL